MSEFGDIGDLITISPRSVVDMFNPNFEQVIKLERLHEYRCVLCDFDFSNNRERIGPNCPKCKSRPRTRTLYLLKKILQNMGLLAYKEKLLAFSKTGLEGKIIDSHFEEVHSVSLYGEYSGEDHKTGVDVRNLQDYEDGAFSGVFGCLLFDYFVEHSEAIKEIYRVLENDGLFFTHIATKRLTKGAMEPNQIGDVKAGKESFQYLGSGSMASVSVGIDWFVMEMKKEGFLSCYVKILDLLSNEEMIWFIGHKNTSYGIQN